MEIIKKYHQLDYYTSRLLDRYFGGMKIGVFDIETLGLNPALTEVVLAGFLEVNPDGSVYKYSYVDVTYNLDERICDGFYYASALKYMRTLFKKPEILDTPPETVVKDIR